MIATIRSNMNVSNTVIFGGGVILIASQTKYAPRFPYLKIIGIAMIAIGLIVHLVNALIAWKNSPAISTPVTTPPHQAQVPVTPPPTASLSSILVTPNQPPVSTPSEPITLDPHLLQGLDRASASAAKPVSPITPTTVPKATTTATTPDPILVKRLEEQRKKADEQSKIDAEKLTAIKPERIQFEPFKQKSVEMEVTRLNKHQNSGFVATASTLAGNDEKDRLVFVFDVTQLEDGAFAGIARRTPTTLSGDGRKFHVYTAALGTPIEDDLRPNTRKVSLSLEREGDKVTSISIASEPGTNNKVPINVTFDGLNSGNPTVKINGQSAIFLLGTKDHIAGLQRVFNPKAKLTATAPEAVAK